MPKAEHQQHSIRDCKIADQRSVQRGRQDRSDQPTPARRPLPDGYGNSSARDLMLALDLSQLMDTRDFRNPSGALLSRIEAVRAVVNDFVRWRLGDRIGLSYSATHIIRRCRSRSIRLALFFRDRSENPHRSVRLDHPGNNTYVLCSPNDLDYVEVQQEIRKGASRCSTANSHRSGVSARARRSLPCKPAQRSGWPASSPIWLPWRADE